MQDENNEFDEYSAQELEVMDVSDYMNNLNEKDKFRDLLSLIGIDLQYFINNEIHSFGL